MRDKNIQYRVWSGCAAILGTCLFLLFLSFNSHAKKLEPLNLATINWDPFYGENLTGNGYFAVISKEAFKLSGYDLNIEFVSWKRAVSGSYKGLYDGLIGSYYHEERAKFVVYTHPVAATEQVFIKSKISSVKYTGEQDLHSLSIAVYTDSITHKMLVNKGYEVESIPEYKMAIKMLLANRFDVFVMSREHLNWLLFKDPQMIPFKHRVEILQPPFAFFDVHNVISREREDAQQIVDAFNDGLKKLKLSGKYDQIMTRFNPF